MAAALRVVALFIAVAGRIVRRNVAFIAFQRHFAGDEVADGRGRILLQFFLLLLALEQQGEHKKYRRRGNAQKTPAYVRRIYKHKHGCRGAYRRKNTERYPQIPEHDMIIHYPRPKGKRLRTGAARSAAAR